MAKEIRRLPIAPDSANPATFNERADAFVKAMQPFADDANALAKELEEFSANVDTKSADVDAKYADLVQKYNDFITKYADFFAKYDIFVPTYLDIKSKHGEVKANKEHVDLVKTQIDEALERAKSFINNGNGGIIDDTKTAETSTFSSTEIVRRLDLKADDATAYKEWNYKEISDDYTAQNNDALFINTTKPITITLPSEGKIKILDMAGNFSKNNVTVIAGGKKLIFNADYQRAELYFYEGQWRATNGFLLEEIDFYEVSAKALSSSGISSGGNYAFYGEYMICTNVASFAIYDIKNRQQISIAAPLINTYSLAAAQLSNDGLHLLYYSEDKWKMFKFNLSLKSFEEKSLGAFRSIYTGSGRLDIMGGGVFVPLILSRSGSTTVVYSVVNGTVGKIDTTYESDNNFFVCRNVSLRLKKDSYRQSCIVNLTTRTKTEINIGGDKVSYDYAKNIIYASNFEKTKLIKINASDASYTEENMDAATIEKYLAGAFSYVATCATQTVNGNIGIKTDGVEITYETYLNNKRTTATQKVNGQIASGVAAGFRAAKTEKAGDTEIAVVEQENKIAMALLIEYKKAKITREI